MQHDIEKDEGQYEFHKDDIYAVASLLKVRSDTLLFRRNTHFLTAISTRVAGARF